MDAFTNGDGTFNLNKYLYFLSVNSERNRLIGENIKSLIGERSLQIVLTLRFEHAKRIYEELRGEDVILLTSKEKIKNNDYNHKIIVSTFQLFKEGVDIPRADTLHIIAPASNNVFFTVFLLNFKLTIIFCLTRLSLIDNHQRYHRIHYLYL